MVDAYSVRIVFGGMNGRKCESHASLRESHLGVVGIACLAPTETGFQERNVSGRRSPQDFVDLEVGF